MPYQVTCRTCSFREVAAKLEDVLALKEAHQAACGDDHDLQFEAIEEDPLFRGGVSDDWP